MFPQHVKCECVSCVYSDSTHLALMSKASDMVCFNVSLYCIHLPFLSTYFADSSFSLRCIFTLWVNCIVFTFLHHCSDLIVQILKRRTSIEIQSSFPVVRNDLISINNIDFFIFGVLVPNNTKLKFCDLFWSRKISYIYPHINVLMTSLILYTNVSY